MTQDEKINSASPRAKNPGIKHGGKVVEKKICKHCLVSFDITDKDLEFYEKVSPVFPENKESCHSVPRSESESLENKNFNSKKDPDPEVGKGGHGNLIKKLGNGKVKYLVPSPTLCPDCRYQLVLSMRNERKLYHRKCDATGKNIVSIHSPQTNFKVYHQEYWWSDNWNALDYGKEFDFSKDFFTQFGELFHNVPKVSLNAPLSINSEYTNQCQNNKNCYMMFCSGDNEDCYYGMWNQDCKYCMDCLYIEGSEHCYELVNSTNCYNCFYSEDLESCKDIYFGKNLINCKNCIGCINLENKEYFVFNKKASKEEYWELEQKLKIGENSFTLDFLFRAKSFFQSFPIKFYHGKQNENSFGDYLQKNKNAFFAYNCRENEDTKYCKDSWLSKFSYDLVEILQVDYSLLVEGTAFGNHCLYTAKSNRVSEAYYSSHCNFSDHLFGCVGLRNKSYCILNKEYSKKEYNKLVPKIISHMQKTGEWGEFFPASISPFGYNETVAQEYFPLTREEVISSRHSELDSESLKRKKSFDDSGIPITGQVNPEGQKVFLHGKSFNWSTYEAPFPKVAKIIPASKLPESIKEIPDDILNWAIECEITKKPFKIIKEELDFYRKHNLPIPKKHPDERHKDRMKLRNPRKLYKRNCDKCGIEIKTSYAPERPEIVYCEECYNREVY